MTIDTARSRRQNRGGGLRTLEGRDSVVKRVRVARPSTRATAPRAARPETTRPRRSDRSVTGARTDTRVSVVIPARNEAANIGWVLRRMPAFVDEVVLVDGHSVDETIEAARHARPDIRVVHDGERGKGEAMRTGAAAASGEYIVMLDADGSMDPAEIGRFVDVLEKGYGFVKGSRFMAGGGTADMTPLRMLGNAGLNVMSNMLFRARWTDLCYGYCAFRREALEQLALDADGFEIETQMVVRATRLAIPVAEVPSFEYPRRYGASQLNTFRDGFRVLATILRERLARSPRRDRAEPAAPGVRVARPTPQDVSVVVCTYSAERRAMLDEVIASIAVGRLAARELILVVDRNPALFEELRAGDWPMNVRVLASEEGGLAAARNVGWRAAGSPLVAFIDDDGFASPGWLEELVGAAAEHDADVVGGRIEPRWTSGAPSWFTPRLGWVVGCTYDGLPTTPAVVRNVIGCNMLLRRELLDELDGFNTSLGRSGTGLAGCEETEICIRANARGARVMYVPGAAVEQVLPSDRATLRHALRRAWAEGRSKRTLVQLHGPVLGTELRYAADVLKDAAAGVGRALLTRRPSEVQRSVGLVGVLAVTTLSYILHGFGR